MASWEVVSPLLPTTMDQAQPKALGVFWDIENCNVPNGKSAIAVCEKIRSQSFFRGHREIQFAVVCDVTREHKGVLEDLDRAQVDILHVGSNRKNAADDKLKQLMRRFADLHRDGSRIVLISGDMDFAADIADFKRRMFLSVILLHSPNASESLINAASSAHNYQELLVAVPHRLDVATADEANLSVSNLPSTTDCPEEMIRRELSEIARRCSGTLKSLNCANGSAILRFPSMDQAGIFKNKFIHHKIYNRSINIHWGPRTRGKSPHQRPRCKSFSQSPGPPTARPRAYSGCERTSREDAPRHLSSSQDSTEADVVEEVQVQVQQGVARLGLGRTRQPSESSLTADISSTEEDGKLSASRRPHAKIKSRLKLKNRKKSEATPEFLGKGEDKGKSQGLVTQVRGILLEEADYCLELRRLQQLVEGGRLAMQELREIIEGKVEVSGDLAWLPLSHVSGEVEGRLVALLDALPNQALRLDTVCEVYQRAHRTNLRRLMDLHSLPSLPLLLSSCQLLVTMEHSGEPYLTLLSSKMVSAHVRRVTDLLNHMVKEKGMEEVPLLLLDKEWRKEGGPGGLQPALLARRPEVTVVEGRAALTPLLKHGYKLVELLASMGGVVPLATLVAQNKDEEILQALAFMDSLSILVRRQGGSIMLEEIWRQLEERGGSAGAPPDVVAGSGGRRLSQLLERGGTPASRSLRQEHMFQPRLSLSSFVGCEVRRCKDTSEGPRTAASSSPPPTPQRSSTPGDIITIEDSEVEGGSPSPRGPGEGRGRGRTRRSEEHARRRSRLAANFSGSEQ